MPTLPPPSPGTLGYARETDSLYLLFFVQKAFISLFVLQKPKSLSLSLKNIFPE